MIAKTEEIPRSNLELVSTRKRCDVEKWVRFQKGVEKRQVLREKMRMANSDLEALSRRELQAKAKQHGIKVVLSISQALPHFILSDPLSLPLSLSLGTGESSERRNCAAAVRHLGE